MYYTKKEAMRLMLFTNNCFWSIFTFGSYFQLFNIKMIRAARIASGSQISETSMFGKLENESEVNWYLD